MNTEVTVVVINCIMGMTEEIEEVEAIILRVTKEIMVRSKNETETITKNDHKNLYQNLNSNIKSCLRHLKGILLSI